MRGRGAGMNTGRILCIGDIHGCRNTFVGLLEMIDLKPADTLYLLGDLIDRGPDSNGVIQTILTLIGQGYDIRAIQGNHEAMLLLAVQSGVFEDLLLWLENGGEATLRSYGVDHPSDLPRDHLHYLENLPLYRIADGFVVVHAGVDCTLADPFSESGRHHMLWDRSGIVDIGKLGGRKVVSGHSTRTLDDVRKSLRKSHLRIDNGVYLKGATGKGNLLSVDLSTREMFVQPNID